MGASPERIFKLKKKKKVPNHVCNVAGYGRGADLSPLMRPLRHKDYFRSMTFKKLQIREKLFTAPSTAWTYTGEGAWTGKEAKARDPPSPGSSPACEDSLCLHTSPLPGRPRSFPLLGSQLSLSQSPGCPLGLLFCSKFFSC